LGRLSNSRSNALFEYSLTIFYGEGLLAPRGPPLVVCSQLLIQYIPSYAP
jgi:hypothetical protein